MSINKMYVISAYKKGYDVYDEAVVVATSKAKARLIHPSGSYQWPKDKEKWLESWVSPDKVHISYLGKAARGWGGVIVASYYAG